VGIFPPNNAMSTNDHYVYVYMLQFCCKSGSAGLEELLQEFYTVNYRSTIEISLVHIVCFIK
jgi:hypothetical protein